MGLLRRIGRFLRAHFSRDARLTDEPERAFEHMLEEIEEHLLEARAEIALCISEERRVADLNAAEDLRARRLWACAGQALRKGQESLAREALTRYRQAMRAADQYRQLWQRQQEGTRQLQRLFEELEGKRAELEYRQQLLRARCRLAHSRRSLLGALYGERGRIRAALLEEHVQLDEFSTEAYQELLPERVGETIDGLGRETHTENVDVLLDRLRTELALPGREDSASRQ